MPRSSIRRLKELFTIRFTDGPTLEVHPRTDPVESNDLAAAEAALRTQVQRNRILVTSELALIGLLAMWTPGGRVRVASFLPIIAGMGLALGSGVYAMRRLDKLDDRCNEEFWKAAQPRRIPLSAEEVAEYAAARAHRAARDRRNLISLLGITAGVLGIILLMLSIQHHVNPTGGWAAAACRWTELVIAAVGLAMVGIVMVGQDDAAEEHDRRLWRLAAPHLDETGVA